MEHNHNHCIEVRNLVTSFGPKIIHNDLSFSVKKGEIFSIVGGSGSGKTVLINAIIGLIKPQSGNVFVDCESWGILYQKGALFSSLNVIENIQLPMRELAHMNNKLSYELAMLKLQMVGLNADVIEKYPSELSGGMIKRVALARAIAVDADLLFLDEPTSGLDPIAAKSFNSLIKTLQKNLNLSVVMITHDVQSLKAISNRVGVLIDKKMITGSLEEIYNNPNPWIQDYFCFFA